MIIQSLAVWMGLVLGTAGPQQADPQPPLESRVINEQVIEFRLASDSYTAGRVQKQVRTEDLTVYVEEAPVLSDADIDRVTVHREAGRGIVIWIEFTEDGAERLAQVTESHIGERLAFVAGGQLYAAPPIRSPITLRRITVQLGELSDGEAARVAAAITAQWPPSRRQSR